VFWSKRDAQQSYTRTFIDLIPFSQWARASYKEKNHSLLGVICSGDTLSENKAAARLFSRQLEHKQGCR